MNKFKIQDLTPKFSKFKVKCMLFVVSILLSIVSVPVLSSGDIKDIEILKQEEREKTIRIEEEKKKQRQKFKNKKLSDRSWSFNSYQTIHQRVHASRYIVKGIPIKVLCFDYKAQKIGDLSCFDKAEVKQVVFALEVEFQEQLHMRKSIKPVHWKEKRFIYPILEIYSGIFGEKRLTKEEIINTYLDSAFYFYCKDLEKIEDSGVTYQYCHNLGKHPPIYPVHTESLSELQKAINSENNEVYPIPEHCRMTVRDNGEHETDC